MSIEYPLERLQNSISRFIGPSVVSSDLGVLKTQIELRRRALREIEIIESHLRGCKGGLTMSLPRRNRPRRPSRLHLGRLLRRRLAPRSA